MIENRKFEDQQHEEQLRRNKEVDEQLSKRQD